MAETADILGAVRSLLLADSDLFSLTSGRIYALELPRSETRSMPRKAIILSLAGGDADSSLNEIARIRVDLICLGETGFESDKVRRTAHAYLKQEALRKMYSDILIHNVTVASGPLFFRDPDTDWPNSVQSFMVTAAEHIAA